MSFFRLVRAGYVLIREGVTRVLPDEGMPAPVRAVVGTLRLVEKRSVKTSDNADRLTGALTRLGPTYIKVGQFLATRPDIVGKNIAASLRLLQDDLPPFPTEIAKKQIADAFGAPCDELFHDFTEPIAAASIAQVHKARIVDEKGEDRWVAVKVLRPKIRQRFKNDLNAFLLAARWVEWLVPFMRRLRPVAAIDTHARSAELELDLRLEAAALSELNENMKDEPRYRTPEIFWRYMSRDVLVTEWIDGLKLSEHEKLIAAGHDLKELAQRVIASFLIQAVRDGYFHADMHQGNLFVEADGTLVAIDGGIMGRINEAESRFLAEILWGFINRDYQRIAEVHFEAGYVPARHKVADFAQALRGIGEPIHGAAAEDISMARLLQQLLDVTDLFDMPLQPQLIFLQRTMVVAEGVARSLDPDFNMWRASEPVLRDWVAHHIGPAAHLRRAAHGLSTLGRLVGELPDLAERAEKLSRELTLMSEQGLRLDERTIGAMGAGARPRAGATAIALWGVAISVALLAAAIWWG
ncbi:MAG: 2-polyprenylphenol 6-hydroxylase [Pseudomonadota bacterium]